MSKIKIFRQFYQNEIFWKWNFPKNDFSFFGNFDQNRNFSKTWQNGNFSNILTKIENFSKIWLKSKFFENLTNFRKMEILEIFEVFDPKKRKFEIFIIILTKIEIVGKYWPNIEIENLTEIETFENFWKIYEIF